MNNDTIFALSSGRGKAGVAVIRISGNDLNIFAKKIIGRATVAPRHAYFTNLRDGAGEIIDQCVVIYFAAPHSFTGTDIIEIQCHGAPAVINKVFEFLRTNGMRIATPGEFSRRAFYAGKMDLSDVDGLVALLDAQTDKQRAAALRSMMGGDSEIYATWREQMLRISAYAAAMTDYDADDLPANISDTILENIKTLYTAISGVLNNYKVSRAIQYGINIAIVGETNVGKSSLFNRLLGTARAIVSDIPGTTRDVVSAQMDIDGYLVNLSDTAGLRDTADFVERIGIERTNNEIKNADIVLHVINPTSSPLARGVRCKTPGVVANEILVVNKSDTIDSHDIKNAIYVSAKTGDGIAELMSVIRDQIGEITNNGESTVMINARTYDLLVTARDELFAALDDFNGDYDILSEHVRYAADAIGRILGAIGTNEILDMTFSQLCLGK
ncbi:MAG: tRNA uridine-5-carboxymethylaminomethyl(34) synthesis GTPase MnmE [Alphaproteobacteria bacterium]|nr:tRNA uridine-5-carboxymethylaminomethyl(34) synthesis GTPase MnmE [Alphaproteobacteria bacterium]